MSVRVRALLAVLIAANVAVGAYVLVARNAGPISPAHSDSGPLRALPVAELYDDGGRRFSTKELIGTPLLVQFVNPAINEQIELLAEIFNDLPKQPLSVLLITPDARLLRARLPDAGDKAIVVEREFKQLRKLFSVPESVEMSFIFDAEGRVVDRKYYYQGGIAARLRSVVDGEKDYSPELLKEGVSSVKVGLLARARERSLRSRSGLSVVVLVSSVCTLCSSGVLVDEVNAAAKRNKDVEFLVVLPKAYGQDDARNLKANLQLEIPVSAADEALSDVWEPLIAKYGEARVNNSVIIIRGGEMSVVQGMDGVNSYLEKVGKNDARS